MKTLICYCVGGLGNRLRPLSSAHAIAEATGRKLLVWWQPSPQHCVVHFKDMFTNELEFITQDQFVEMGFPRSYDDSDNFLNLKARQDSLSNQFPKQQLRLDDPKEHVLAFGNSHLGLLDPNTERRFLKSLKPVPYIQQQIDEYRVKLNLSTNTIGVHARGTDLEIPLQFYLDRINAMHAAMPDRKFFVISDDKIYKQIILDLLPNHVVYYPCRDFTIRNSPEVNSWRYQDGFYNSLIPAEGIIDSIIEMYLMSYTDFAIYSESTFADMILTLRN